jgi:hypothetical protein
MGENQSARSTTEIAGIILFLFPGLLFLAVSLFQGIGQTNPFILLIIILLGGIAQIVGLVMYLVAASNLKIKLLHIGAGITFYLLILPVIWGANFLKEIVYIEAHQEELEIIAEDLLANRISIETANEMLKSKNYLLQVICIPKEQKHVLFILGGLIDNCVGFSYSLTDKRPSENCCGDLIKWTKLRRRWYKWGTT